MKKIYRKKKESSPDFHISGFKEDELIKVQNGGLDDVSSVNCDMYNFGNMENLPDSDRMMIPKDQTCKDYLP